MYRHFPYRGALHLAILLAGLRPGAGPLPGTGLTLADLRGPAVRPAG
jgi:hypothetical protein